MSENFDIIIIGGGPGGYVAAIRASQLGLKVALVEKEHLGGICLNWGCIPTKSLLRCSEIYHLMQHADQFGLYAKEVGFDLEKIVQRSRSVSSQLAKGVAHLMKKNKVQVFEGHGKLLGKHQVEVKQKDKTQLLKAPHIILATGARPRIIKGLEPDYKNVWTYKEAMIPKTCPQSLLVVGSGAIGVEFASFYQSLGVKVTLVEVMPKILPVEDEEISDIAHRAFAEQGMEILTQCNVKKMTSQTNEVKVELEVEGKKDTRSFERVILAVGIVANTEELGLEKTKIKLDKGHIQVNQWLETDEKGVYAIGDIVGAPWLAHKASHEAVICVEKIANVKEAHPLITTNIPGCTYCHPQIASVGLTEKAAKDKGYKVKVGRFSHIANGKAIAMGDTKGLVKTIFDEKTGELLGAHMVGPEVTEMIQGFVIAKTMETTEADLMQTVFPHPTLSEAMHESVLDAYDRVLHM